MDIYTESKRLMKLVMDDLAILAGDKPGSGTSWQDVAGTACVNLVQLSLFIKAVREGENHFAGCPLTGPRVFASPSEVLEMPLRGPTGVQGEEK